MHTINVILVLLASLLLGSAQALTVPVMQVSRVSAVDPVDRIVSHGGEDYHPVATTSITYTVRNTGALDLGLSAVIIEQVTAGISATVTSQPASPVAPGGSTTFTVTLSNPSLLSWGFLIRAGSTDRDANPYTWAVYSGNPRSEISVSYHFVEVPDGSVFTNAVRVGQADPVTAQSTYRFVIRNTGVAPLNITGISFPGGTGQIGGVSSINLVQPRIPDAFPVPTPANPLVVLPGFYQPFYVNVGSDGITLDWYATITITNDEGLTGSSERSYEFGIESANGTDFNGFEQQTPGRGEIRLAFLDNYTEGDDIVVNNLLNRGVYQVDPTRPRSVYKVERGSGVGETTTYGMLIGNASAQAGMSIDSPVSVVTSGVFNASAAISAQPSTPVPVRPPTGYPILSTGFSVQVTPLSDGPWAVPVTFRADDSDGEDPYTMTLIGYAYGAPNMDVRRGNATLTTTGSFTGILSAVGFVNTHDLIITNVGSGPLLLADLVPTPVLTNCSVVGTPTWSATTVPVGGTATYTIRTTPTTMAFWSCVLSLTSNEPTTPFGITLSGTATPPIEEMDLFYNTTPIANGGSFAPSSSLVSQATAYSFRIQNSGTGPLTVTSATASAPVNCSVTVSAPTSVAATDPPSSGALVVTVTPPAEGAWSCVITILNSDADEGTYVMNLSGVAMKLKPQDDCGLGSGFSLLLMMLMAAILPLASRRR